PACVSQARKSQGRTEDPDAEDARQAIGHGIRVKTVEIRRHHIRTPQSLTDGVDQHIAWTADCLIASPLLARYGQNAMPTPLAPDRAATSFRSRRCCWSSRLGRETTARRENDTVRPYNSALSYRSC